MYCEVIPSRRFPKDMGIFDYKIPDSLVIQIKIGQLVTIPFRKSEKEGIIIKIKQTGIAGKNIREIKKINQAEPTLTENQIKLADWISRYYFVSLGTVIKTMLPAIPKRQVKKDVKLFHNPIPQPNLPIELSDQIYKLIRSNKKYFFYWTNSQQKKTCLFYWLINRIKQNILIIVPEISDMDFYLGLLPKKLMEKTAIFNSGLNINHFYQNWQKVMKNEAKIIIGTKLALFVPFQKLDYIIFDQEEDQNHKQSDQNPRLDSRDTALKLTELYQAKIIFQSHAPTVESIYKINRGFFQLIKINHDYKSCTFQQDFKPRRKNLFDTPSSLRQVAGYSGKVQDKNEIHLIDQKEEIKKKNFSIFSDKLLDSIKNSLLKKQKIFLFINRRGASSSVICRDCGYVLRCKKCGLPMVLHTTNNLYCHHCLSKEELPPFCPKCSSVRLKNSGIGTQKVETEIKNIFPQAKVKRIDKDLKPTKDDFEIAIGTEFAFKQLDFEKINFIGVILAETTLYLPDFKSSERTYQLLSKFSFLNPKAKIIIQTYTPENISIKSVANQNPDLFYHKELDARKSFNYPPFYKLIKSIQQNKDKKICVNNTNRLFNILTNFIKFKKLNIEISVLTPFVPLVNKKWQMYIIVKYPFNTQENIIKEFIKLIPDNWLIDRDPASLL